MYVPPEPKEPEQGQKPTQKTGVTNDAATKKQLAAQWMLNEVNQAGSLGQATAADYINKKFKGKCTEQTELGNLLINKKTRDAFKKLHRGTVEWENGKQVWYKT